MREASRVLSRAWHVCQARLYSYSGWMRCPRCQYLRDHKLARHEPCPECGLNIAATFDYARRSVLRANVLLGAIACVPLFVQLCWQVFAIGMWIKFGGQPLRWQVDPMSITSLKRPMMNIEYTVPFLYALTVFIAMVGGLVWRYRSAALDCMQGNWACARAFGIFVLMWGASGLARYALIAVDPLHLKWWWWTV